MRVSVGESEVANIIVFLYAFVHNASAHTGFCLKNATLIRLPSDPHSRDWSRSTACLAPHFVAFSNNIRVRLCPDFSQLSKKPDGLLQSPCPVA